MLGVETGADRPRPRRPALVAALALALGIALAARSTLAWPWAVVAVAAMVIPWFGRRRTESAIAVVCLLLLAAVGAARYLSLAHIRPSTELKVDEVVGERATIYGAIVSEPERRSDRVRFVLQLDSILAAPQSLRRTGRVQVVLDTEASVGYGDYLVLGGRFSRAAGARNFGEFDYAAYLERRDILARFFARASDLQPVTRDPPGFDLTAQLIVPLRARIYDALRRHIPGPEVDLLLGLVFGERRGLASELEAQFQNTGTLHLLAVSGGNVAVVIAVLWGALAFTRLSPACRRPLVLAGIFVFARLSYNEPSVLRASTAAALATVGLARHRAVDPFNLWGAALFLLLLWEPRQLFEIGFQLSFMATLGILAGMPLLRPAPRGSRPLRRAVRAVGLALGVSLAAQVAVVPIMALAFNQVPLITPLSNLACVPLAGLATAAGLVTLLAAPFGSFLHSTAAAAAWVSVRALIEAVSFFDSLHFPQWYPSSPSGLGAAAYYAVCGALWLFASRPRWRRVLVFALIASAGGGLWHAAFRGPDPVTIAHLDLRTQGCSAIRWPDGNVWLVLTGETREAGIWTGSVSPFLRRWGWRSPSLVVGLGPETDLDGVAREWPGARIVGGEGGAATSECWPPVPAAYRVTVALDRSAAARALRFEAAGWAFIWYSNHHELDSFPPFAEGIVWGAMPALPWDYEKWLEAYPQLVLLECAYKDVPRKELPGRTAGRAWSVLTSGAIVTSGAGGILSAEPSIR